jgi:hypothetical protein
MEATLGLRDLAKAALSNCPGGTTLRTVPLGQAEAKSDLLTPAEYPIGTGLSDVPVGQPKWQAYLQNSGTNGAARTF